MESADAIIKARISSVKILARNKARILTATSVQGILCCKMLIRQHKIISAHTLTASYRNAYTGLSSNLQSKLSQISTLTLIIAQVLGVRLTCQHTGQHWSAS